MSSDTTTVKAGVRVAHTPASAALPDFMGTVTAPAPGPVGDWWVVRADDGRRFLAATDELQVVPRG